MTSIDQKNSKTFDVLGLDVAITNLERAAHTILGWANDNTGRFVCVRDVHGVMLSVKSPRLRQLHKSAAMITPDGMPLVFLGRLAGHDIGRACGADLMEKLIEIGQNPGIKHYFFGGKPGVAELLVEKFEKTCPKAKIVGIECPPFREFTPAESVAIIDRITKSKADILWVGMSTPKQEYWMESVFKKLPATLIGVGAAFDFHAGQVRRAPKWMQKSGLEWLHRLASEPRRLWRRYLILAPKFVWLVVSQKLKHGKTL